VQVERRDDTMLRFPDVRRMMLIGDSVFAVSITLLAHAVEIPKQLSQAGFDSPQFQRFLVDLGSVILSVVVASMFWLGHWRYLRHVRTANVPLIAAHFGFLLGLIVLPISTSLFANNANGVVATVVYSTNLLYESVLALVFRYWALRNTPHADLTLVHHAPQTVLIVLFTLSLVVAFRSPSWAQALWYAGLLTPFLEMGVTRHLARRQRARHHAVSTDRIGAEALP